MGAPVAAIKELLDRGYGRAVQPIQGTLEYGVSQQLAELFKENASGTLGSETPSAVGQRAHTLAQTAGDAAARVPA